MDKRYGHDVDYDVGLTKPKPSRTKKRVRPEPTPRYQPDQERKPVNIKRKIRELTIEGMTAAEIVEIINRVANVSKVLVSAIRTDTRETMKVLDEMGYLKNITR